ncbi:hypothetical protein LOTGIDRAFT_165965 [Lottia gigantea]|uniref:RING-type domain-containing protein n=1 Tax=Lottia gigantea TaxID=225164 RepID=V3ZZ78_LOTGI|nr:hypothetical protein LOTGIDRAFT_165965 [Lottia gigantea]ESO87945.1 hypothetical protein LOTGIDRAFT_165965 [Lottia gigantea]
MSKESRKKSHASSVSEKVKEIKQRQDNWMKQRANYRDEEVSVKKSNGTYKKENFPKDSSDRQIESSPDVKNKFKNWLEKREKVKNRNNDTLNGFDVEVKAENFDRIVVNSHLRSECESDFQLLQERLLSTKDFDAKADSIVNKVRRDLNLSSKSVEPIDRSQSCIENHVSKYQDKNSYLPSHLCPVCTVSMVSSKNSPMLLIPCGHTVCQHCSDQSQMCAVCDCDVTNVTCNIMLQQIIQEYGVPKKQDALHQTRHQSAKTIGEYSSNKYQNKSQPKKVSQYKKYQEQLESFETRIEILQNEHMSVSEEIKDMDTQIGVEHRQLRNIERQRTQIEDEISQLQDKLQTLGQHEEEYHEKCANLEHVKDELKTKMLMLDDTIASLKQEVEKVSLYSYIYFTLESIHIQMPNCVYGFWLHLSSEL